MWTAPSHASKASAPGVRVSTENTEFADDVVTDADEAALLQPFSREYASRPTHHDARRSHHDEGSPAECLHSRRERGAPSRHRLACVAHRGRCPRSHRTSVYNRASFGPVAQWLEQGTHNPLVVCSNHTGPSLLVILNFQHRLLLGGCGLDTTRRGPVSKTVSNCPLGA